MPKWETKPSPDQFFMAQALTQAQKAIQQGEVPVGAVIVFEGKIIASAHNTREAQADATAHAEILAIKQACNALGNWRLSDCELYVTLEPCPMCAGAIINARIKRVIFGAKDPNMGCCGSVCNLFAMDFANHPKITGGILEEECKTLLQAFFKEKRNN